MVEAGKHVKDKKLGKCFKLLYNLRCLDGNRFVTIKYIGARKPGLGENREQDLAIPSENSEVWISCTCPFHLFNTEYALTKHNSSEILYGNGKPARIRNPNNIGFVCKHAVLALEKSFQEAGRATSEAERELKRRQDDAAKLEQKRDPNPVDKKVEPVKEENTTKKPEVEKKPPASWKDKLTDWIKTKDQKEQPPKGKAPTSWRDRLTDWMKK